MAYKYLQIDCLSDRTLKSRYLNSIKWTEEFVQMLRTLDDGVQASRVVRLGFEVDLQLGAKLLGAVKPEFQENAITFLLDMELPDWLDIYLLRIANCLAGVPILLKIIFSEYGVIAEQAKKLLGEIGTLGRSEFIISTLIEALQDADWEIRSTIASTFGELGLVTGIETAILFLIDALEDQNQFVRGSAAKSIGKLEKIHGVEQAISRLAEMLRTEKHFLIRLDIAEALGNLSACEGFEMSTSCLIEALQRDKDDDVRGSIADLLGKIYLITKDATILDSLISILIADEEDSCLKACFAEAIVNANLQDKTIPILLASLKSTNSEHRYHASSGFYVLVSEIINKFGLLRKIEDLIPDLLDALSDNNPNVRENITGILGDLCSEKAVPGLLQALEDSEANVRKQAVYGLMRVKTEIAIPNILKRIEDVNAEVRWTVIKLIGEQCIELGVPRLIKALEDEDSYVQESAAKSLGLLKAEVAIPALQKALESENLHLRCEAANALGKIGTDAANNSLLRALENETSYVLLSIVEALGNDRRKDVIPILIRSLAHEEDYVRIESAKALAKFGLPEAVPRLLELLENGISTSNWGRSRASEALINLAECWANEGKINLVASLLPQISRLPPLSDWHSESKENPEALETLKNFQKICGFYNYDIWVYRAKRAIARQITLTYGDQKAIAEPKQDQV